MTHNCGEREGKITLTEQNPLDNSTEARFLCSRKSWTKDTPAVDVWKVSADLCIDYPSNEARTFKALAQAQLDSNLLYTRVGKMCCLVIESECFIAPLTSASFTPF